MLKPTICYSNTYLQFLLFGIKNILTLAHTIQLQFFFQLLNTNYGYTYFSVDIFHLCENQNY